MEKQLLFHLKAADSYIDLTAALVWTVEHLEHPVCLNDGASPAPLGPDTTKEDAADLVHNHKGQYVQWISAMHLDFKSSSICPSVTGVHHAECAHH